MKFSASKSKWCISLNTDTLSYNRVSVSNFHIFSNIKWGKPFSGGRSVISQMVHAEWATGIGLRDNDMLSSEMVFRGGTRSGAISCFFYLSIYLTAPREKRQEEREGKKIRRGREGTGWKWVALSPDMKVLPVETLHEHRSALRGVLRTPAGHKRAILGFV